jgi:probable lipoprotein NlpC
MLLKVAVLSVMLQASHINLVSLNESFLTRLTIIMEASNYIGLKYKAKFEEYMLDCSGYAKMIMEKCGIPMSRTSQTQIHEGEKIANLADVKPGDLLIFKGRNLQSKIPGHVGIAHHWQNDTLYFIHSSSSRGIVIDPIESPYWKKRFLEARNVVDVACLD